MAAGLAEHASQSGDPARGGASSARAAAWCGLSEAVAEGHHRKMRESDFEAAIKGKKPQVQPEDKLDKRNNEHGERAGQNAAQ